MEYLFQALDELDDWLAIVRQQWLLRDGDRPIEPAVRSPALARAEAAPPITAI